MSIGILFVCLGNICRSPAAQGAFEYLVQERRVQNHFHIESCGTAKYHIGELPHPTTRSVAKRHGIHLRSRARAFQSNDFSKFNYILAMDRSNYDALRQEKAQSEEERARVKLFRSFDPSVATGGSAPDVPDPYYGGISGFEEVHEIVWRTSQKLLEQLVHEHNLLKH